MLLQKITINYVIVFITSLILLGLLLNGGMVVIQALQTARSIDETQTVSTSPVLQKQLLKQAMTILESQKNNFISLPTPMASASAEIK